MKYLTYEKIVETLSKQDQDRFLVGGTSVRPNDALQKIITATGAKRIVEIGTGFGTSAIAITSCSNVEYLLTLDVKQSIWPEYLARKFNLSHKIQFIAAANSQEIYEIIGDQEFDLAYIDGCHVPPYTENDFNAVKYIGQVLFDDVYSNYVRQIVESVGGFIISNRFAYWNLEGNYETAERIRSEITSDDPVKAGKLVHNYGYLKNE